MSSPRPRGECVDAPDLRGPLTVPFPQPVTWCRHEAALNGQLLASLLSRTRARGRIRCMRKRVAPPVELETVEELLRRWRKRHGAPSKVAAAHRRVLLDRVAQSMAFENEPVSMARLKALLKARKRTVSR